MISRIAGCLFLALASLASAQSDFILQELAEPGKGNSSVSAVEPQKGVKVRIDYQNSAEIQNHVVFKSVMYSLDGRAEKDKDGATRIVQKPFGGASEAEAAVILDRIRETIVAFEQGGHTARKRLLCGHGSLQSKDAYYKRLDALDDAQFANLKRHYIVFMAALNEPQSEAFVAYLESRKTKVQFWVLEHKSSYENSPFDVLDVVTQACAQYGTGL